MKLDYKSIINSLKSTRDFKDEMVPDKIIEEIISYAKESHGLFEGQDIHVHYLKDGEDVCNKLQGVAGYPGLMIKAPQYLLFSTQIIKNHQINVGYFVEKILLQLKDKDVDSCWIDIPEAGDIVKEVLDLQTDEEIAALIGIGYDNNETKVVNTMDTGDNYSKSDMKIVENNVSPRLSMNEVVYIEKWGEKTSVEAFIDLALDDVFRYALMAPSSYNRQPWRFILKGKELHLFIREDDFAHNELNLLDAGIIMLYIEILMRDSSIVGSWKVKEKCPFNDIPDVYQYIGCFS